MTVEIKQLVIRAAVENGNLSAARAPEVSPEPKLEQGAPESQSANSEYDYDAIIAACVREVLRRIRRSSER